MATELASAYVSLSVNTSKIPGEIRRAFRPVGADARAAGRLAGRNFGEGLASTLNTGSVEARLAHLARDRNVDVEVNVDRDGRAAAALQRIGSSALSIAGTATKITAVGLAAGAAVPAVSTLGSTLGGTVAAGAGVGIAAMSAYGLATATLKVGLAGVGDAAKLAFDPSQAAAFSESIKGMGPVAQSGMRAVQSLGKAWEAAGVKQAVQEKLFAGLDLQILSLSQHIPSVKRAMLSVADGFNTGAKSALAALNSAQGARQINTILSQSSVAAANMGRALGQLVPGLMSIATSATRVFSTLSTGLEGGAKGLANMLQAAERSGRMDQFFRDALDSAKQFGQVLLQVGGIIGAVFSAAGDAAGEGGIGGMADSLREVNAALSAGEGAAGLREFFTTAKETAATAMTLVGALGGHLLPVIKELMGEGGGLSSAIEGATPAFDALGETIANVAPAAAGAIGAIGEAAGSIIPALAPIVQIGGSIIEAITPIVPVVASLVGSIAPALELVAGLMEDNQGLVTALVMAYLGLRVVPAMIGMIRAGWNGTATATAGATGAAGRMTTALNATGAAAQGAATRYTALRTAATGIVTANGRMATSTGAITTNANQASMSMGRVGSSIAQLGTHVGVVQRMQQSFLATSQAASTMGRTQGAAAAGMTGLKAAGSAVAGVFGGPLGMALTGVALGGGFLASKSAEASAAMDAWRESTEALKKSQVEMGTALMATGGQVDDSIKSIQSGQIKTFTEDLENAAEAAPSAGDQIRRGLAAVGAGFAAAESGTYERINTRADDVNRLAGDARKAGEAIKALGLTGAQLEAQVYGSQATYQTTRDRLVAMGAGGQSAATRLDALRNEFLAQQAAAARVDPAVRAVGKAFAILGDEASSASQRTKALQDALDGLAGNDRSKSETLKKYNDEMRRLSTESKEAWDRTQGFGQALVGNDRKISTATANGSKLYDALQKMSDATVEAAEAGNDLGPIIAENDKLFADLSKQTGLSVEKLKELAKATFSYNPKDLEVLVGIKGGDKVMNDLANIKLKMDNTPNGKTFEMEVGEHTPAVEQALDALGVKFRRLPDGKTMEITADDKAKPVLDKLIESAKRLGANPAVAKILADGTGFQNVDKQVRDSLTDLSSKTADPKIKAAIDQFLSGKNVTLADLALIDATIADPTVRGKFQDAITGITKIKADLASIPAGKEITTTMPGGPEVLALLTEANAKVTTGNEKEIVVEAPLAPAVIAQLKALGLEVRTNNGKTVIVRQDGVQKALDEQKRLTRPETKIINVKQNVESVGSFFGGGAADGGLIPRLANGGRPDSVRGTTPLDGGDYIVNAAATRQFGSFLRRLAPTGSVIRGPGGPRDDVIAGRSGGRTTALVSNGEYRVPARSVGPVLGALDAINYGGRRGARAVGAYADGGEVRTARWFDELAEGRHGASRPLEGAPYGWAGINWGDCSSTQSAFARGASGMDPFGGRYATGSAAGFLQQWGFSRGLGPSGSLRVGYFNGGPGGGHATTQLPSGKFAEMGGNNGGGSYPDGANPAEARFTDKWHKVVPRDAASDTTGATGADSPDGTSTTASESPRQSMASTISGRFGDAAKAAVEGQVQDILSVFGINDSPAFLQAQGEFEQARRDHKAKDGTVRPKPGEDGGDLPGRPSGTSGSYVEQIVNAFKRKGLPKAGAVVGMAAAFTEVGNPIRKYANPKVPESLRYPHDAVSSDGTSVGDFQQQNPWGPVAVRMDSAGSAGLFADALKKVHGWEELPPGLAAQEVQKSAYPDRYEKHVPAARREVDKVGVYDTGGVVPHRGVAINTSGHDEYMLSPQQWQDIKGRPAAQQAPQQVDMSIHINQPTYANEQALAASVRRDIRRQQRRFLSV